MNRKLNCAALALLFAGNELRHICYRRRMERLCDTDPLTGLKNRSCLERQLSRYGKRSLLGVVFWDIDGLKSVNDTLGHAEGDRKLKKLADSLRNTFGDIGELYRYGGDEFLLITEGISEKRLAALCASWEKLSPVSASYGYAVGDGKELPQLINCADMKMYKYKQHP